MKRIITILTCLFVMALTGFRGLALQAQTDDLAGVYGTEFWLAFLNNSVSDPKVEKSFKITLYAVSEKPVKLVAQSGTSSWNFTAVTGSSGKQYFYKLEGLKVETFCPAPDESETVVKRGISIKSSKPTELFSCYAIVEVGGKSVGSMRDATLLLPKDLLGKEYFIQTYPKDSRNTEFAVVATENKTVINVTPSCETYNGSAAGKTITKTLNAGEVFMVKSKKADEADVIDLSGSTICADKPIAVFNGNVETKMENTGGASGNHTFEQCIPQTMWGTDFYVALAGGTKFNKIQITASYDNTKVTIKRPGVDAQVVTLNRGKSLTTPIELSEQFSNIQITSEKPVLCYHYLTLGTSNQETETIGWETFSYDWGHPTNALIVPWSHRAKEMSFYTQEIENHTEGAKQKFFVQIITDKPNDGKIILDDVTIPSTEFKQFGANANMVYVNKELTTHGKHHISTVGSGFTGLVHGMTAEARAYEYTLGFDPPKYLDSLFIENLENVMSTKSYDLERMENKGWYQRQPVDFPIEDQRIDTAVVCDSTLLNFFGLLAAQNITDEVVWSIYKCEVKNGKVEKILPAVATFQNSEEDGKLQHRYSYMFTVDPQKDKPANLRDPFTYYAVDMEKYKAHLICKDLPKDADTLRTMVRVQREYNDTTWRIVCVTDTVHFFKEVEASRFVKGTPAPYASFNKETVFQYNKENLSQGIVKFEKDKDNTYTRWYKSVNGCDSIVTLKIYGCDTIYHRLDTTICEEGLKTMVIKDDYYPNRFFGTKFKVLTQAELLAQAQSHTMQPYTELYRNARLTKTCSDTDLQPYLDHGCKYSGCPDTFDLYLTIMPRLYYETDNPQTKAWCVGTDETETYDEWKRADGTIIRKIAQNDPAFNVEEHLNVGYFADTTWWPVCTSCPDKKRCPKEINLLHLRKVDSKPVVEEVHICQNETYTHMTFMKKDRKEYKGWVVLPPQSTDPTPVEIIESHTVDVIIGGKKECEFTATLKLYVHPAYVKTSNFDTEKKETASICVAKTETDHFEWANHIGAEHKVYQLFPNNTQVKVDPANISTQSAGTFIFIDSLRTKTCAECNKTYKGYCDSVHRLTLTVAPHKTRTVTREVCRNDSIEFNWKGTTYYYYGEGYVGPATTKTHARLLEDKDWLNVKCDGTKYYEQIFSGKTSFDCDSIVTLRIKLKNTFVTSVDTFICETQTYNFFGEKHKWDYVPGDANMYELKKTVPSKCGCDSGVTHRVYVRPVYANLQDKPDTVCQSKDDYYTWDKHPRSGEPARDIWMINVKTNAKKKVSTDAIPLSTAGTFTLLDSLKTKTCPKCQDKGCDSITRISLTIIPTYNRKNQDIPLASEGYYLWDDTLFLGSANVKVPTSVIYKHKIIVPGSGCYTHTQHHTTVDALGHSVGTHKSCDSIVTQCIKVGMVFRDTAYAPVCENCEYKWHIVDPNTGKAKDIFITDVPKAGESRWYYDSLKTIMKFDSIYNLRLTGFPTKYAAEEDEVCQGDPFTWIGHPGQRDSLYIIDGDVATPIKTNDFIKTISKEYGTYLIRDSLLTDTVFYNPKTKKNERVRCDSIWELTLTVHPTYTERYNYDKVNFPAYLCSNDTLFWNHRLFVGYDYDEAAHPIPAATNETPYDSILYIPRKANLQFYDSVPYPFGTKTYGCDSINYVTIHISRYDTTWVIDHIGDNNTKWHFGGSGGTFSYEGKTRITREDLVPASSIDYSDPDRHEIKQYFFIDTVPSVLTGCDSIVWDSVYIHPSYRFQFDTLLCSNNDWDWRKYKNINTFVTGYYYDSLHTEAYGIDSVFVLNLTIQPGAKHYFGKNICKNDTVLWELQQIYYTENKGDIEVKYKTGSDCDSILIFKPVFYEYHHFPVEHIDGDSICRFDTLVWISEGETNPHTAALRGENGEPYTSLPTDTVGWITIYDSLHTTAPCHCDSTYTLRYYVKPSYRFYDTATICSNDTLEWRGQILYSDTASVIHTKDSYATVGGACDSIYYLTLYVNQAYDSLRYDTICGNTKRFEWEGHNLTDWLQLHLVDTLPSDTFLLTRYDTQLECDSVFKLHLNVRPILTEEWSDTICVGETYTLNTKQFTTSGIYRDTIPNSFGCDSFAVVNLTVVPATDFKVEPMILCADQGGYDLVFTFDTVKGFPPRTVRVIYDSLAKACGYPEDTLTLPVVGNAVEMLLPEPQTGESYVRPNSYAATIYFDNGTCDNPEMQRVDFQFTVNYPSWLLEQHWADAIGILAEEYNGGYTFVAYQWYKDGKKLVGETKPYYFAPEYLEVGAEYSVELTRESDSISLFTCAITAQKRNNTLTPQKPYVSVVPTYVVKDNPVVYIMCSQYGGEYKIYNPYGSLIQSGHFEPGEHNAYEVRLPALSGVYMFELIQENGEQRTVKVLVN